ADGRVTGTGVTEEVAEVDQSDAVGPDAMRGVAERVGMQDLRPWMGARGGVARVGDQALRDVLVTGPRDVVQDVDPGAGVGPAGPGVGEPSDPGLRAAVEGQRAGPGRREDVVGMLG